MANLVSDQVGDSAADEVTEPADRSAARWRGLSPLVVAILAGLLTLAIGFAAGVLVAQPDHPGHDSPEAGFARDMSLHHSQAVEMGMIAWQKAALEETRTLGYDIALTQQAQIGIMRGWLDKWDLPRTSAGKPMQWMEHGEHMLQPDGRMPGMASEEQMEALRNAEGEEVDRLFFELMITHHQAGVEMAEAVVKVTDDPEVKKLAQGMIDAQQYEIEVMQALLAKVSA